MKSVRDWISFFVYLGIWIFGFTIVDALFVKYDISDEDRFLYIGIGLILLCLYVSHQNYKIIYTYL